MKSIVIHGGIQEFEGGNRDTQHYQDALRLIVSEAFEVLVQKGAHDAVLHAVSALENNPAFNAGTGSRIQADGEIRMSAALVNGVDGVFAGVVNIQNVKNPIAVAATLTSANHTVLAGKEATDYARRMGFEPHDPLTVARIEEYRRRETGKTGTVGAVAVDDHGKLYAGTSTGGVGGETPGRMSDSATVAGTYATPAMGISLTGAGEQIVNHAAAARICTRVEDGLVLSQAVDKTITEARHKEYQYGLIALDQSGKIIVDQTRGTTLWASCVEREVDSF